MCGLSRRAKLSFSFPHNFRTFFPLPPQYIKVIEMMRLFFPYPCQSNAGGEPSVFSLLSLEANGPLPARRADAGSFLFARGSGIAEIIFFFFFSEH